LVGYLYHLIKQFSHQPQITTMTDLDNWIEHVRKGQYLPEHKLKQLCQMVKAILLEESNVQPVSSPVTVCGDIHGQFHDLLELFKTGGEIPKTKYIFMVCFCVNFLGTDCRVIMWIEVHIHWKLLLYCYFTKPDIQNILHY
jgi:hypothetical protein